MIRPQEIRKPLFIWFATLLVLPVALWGPNTVIGLVASLVLMAGVGLLWRPGEPPILLFIFLYQWMQSAMGALYGNIRGIALEDVLPLSGRHQFASGIMLGGTLVLALAMRAAAGKPLKDLHARMKLMFGARPFSYWFRIYIAAWLLGAVCEAIAPMAGGLRLVLLTLSESKWGAFVLLTFAAFAGPNPTARTTWALVFLAELAMSVGGFFATFKEVFFYAIFGVAASSVRLRPRVLLAGALLSFAVIALGLVWTAIKKDYRSFANAGTGQQVVLVDYSARISEFGRLLGRLDAQTLDEAADEYAKRVMYHHLFASAARFVPAIQPHANGEIWIEAATRAFLPRVLFPDKRVIHDSELTNRYTGLDVAGAEQGTSISLGYMAEAYIDFGATLMFVVIAALGVCLGLYYRWLLNQRSFIAVIGAALAPFALMPAHLAETSSLKMVPSLILSLLVCFLILRLLAPMALGRPARPVPRRT